MNNFIMGFLLGRRCSKPSLKPSKETLNRHDKVLNYVEKKSIFFLWRYFFKFKFTLLWY